MAKQKQLTDSRIRPSKNRLTQVSRTGGRKLFDARRKAVFSEWFAATCNVTLSAGRAGVTRQCVFKHRAADAAFADGWDEALAQGYASLEAGLLADALGFDERDTFVEDGGPPEAGACDAGGAPLSFEQRLAVYRELKRGAGAAAGRDARRAERMTRLASDDEVEAALVARLKSFAIRQVGQSGTLAEGSEEQ